jgi:hypothetical protein
MGAMKFPMHGSAADLHYWIHETDCGRNIALRILPRLDAPPRPVARDVRPVRLRLVWNKPPVA